ncbi:MAG: phasin superfamily protein [Syntrophotaleaceae bacterium]
MNDLIEKTLLAGIGALALSQKKAEELVEGLQRQFNLSEEKGQELRGKLQEALSSQQQRLEEVARKEIKASVTRLGLVDREEFDTLAVRVTQLEKLLKQTP